MTVTQQHPAPAGPAAFPLLAGQAEIWYDEQFSGGTPAYNSGAYLDIRGPVDPALVEAAVRRLLDEAECTRIRFLVQDGLPRQTVQALPAVPLSRHDLSAQADPEAAARQWMDTDLLRPFAIDAFPLIRLAELRLGPERTWLYLCNHHAISDGYSHLVYWRRFAEIYAGLAAGADVGAGALPGLRLLVEEEQSYLGTRFEERDRAFWQDRFARPTAGATLSTRSPVDSLPRGFLRRTRVLDEPTSSAVRGAAAAAGVSTGALLMAATALYTHRITGAPDVTLTVAASARTSATALKIPGMTANFLPLQVRLDGTESRPELLRRTAADLSKLLRHQRYRVGAIRRDLGLQPTDRWPVGPFVNMLPLPTALDLGPCTATAHNLTTGLVNDLMVTTVDNADQALQLNINGNPDLYHADEVADHTDRFAHFLGRFAGAAEQTPVGRIALLDAAEAGAYDRMSHGAATDEPYLSVAAAIRAVAAHSPDAVALIDGPDDAPRELTYRQLLARANALTPRLPATGLVGVLAGPGAAFVVGMLGIWGAGAAYVPLDVQAPSARTAGLVADNGISCLLADAEHQELAAEIAASTGAGTVLLDDAEHPEPAELTGLPDGPDAPDALAYVIFTSGSTGTPKGAMVQHGGMVNHLRAKIEDLDLTSADTVLQNAPLTFDISVWQLLAGLLVGGRVRIVSRTVAADPNLLFPLAVRESVTVAEVVPSLLRAALDAWDVAGDGPRLPALRWLLVTGEAMPAELCERWFRREPAIPVLNAYGPTECSDDVTHAVLTADDGITGAAGRRVPIGRAVRNTSLYVLDDNLAAVPRGVIGELYVSGAGVGRGYLGDAPKTAATFLPDPFAGGGARMYRTGDRVLWRADGQLEFVERRDHQVKLRGNRIELAEIEAAMLAQAHVRDAAVTVFGELGRQRLVGYVVPTDATQDDPARLRERLGAVLPAYMVPSVIVALDALPLTGHGKVDRKALPEPDAEDVVRAGGSSKPQTPGEELLCRLFAEALGLSEVGPDDNFFDLGGDSIISIQVSSRIGREGLQVTPQQIFQLKTPTAIAAAAVPVRPPSVPRPEDGVGAVEPPPVAAQLCADLALLASTGLPEAARRYGQYVVVDVPPGTDTDRLGQALQAVLDHHDALRMQVSVPVAGQWVMETLPPGSVKAGDVLTEAAAAPIPDLAAAAGTRMDPEHGIVTQAVLVRGTHDAPDRLLWLVNHLCVDGVSWRVLVPDLREAWEAVMAGRDIALDPVGTSYRQWCRTLSRDARSSGRLAEFPAWLEQVRDSGPPLAGRPLDPLRDTYATGHALRLVLPPEVTRPLLGATPAVLGVEVNDVLLTALAIAVADWRRRRGEGAGQVLVELEGHGREPIDGEDLARTVGWFTSVFPVRLDTSADGDDLDWDDLWAGGAALQRLAERTYAAPGRGLGYGLLRYLNAQTQAALARFAPPELGLNYLGRFAAGTGTGAWQLDGGDAVISTATSPDTPLRHVLAVTPVTEDRPEGPHLVADWLWAGELFADTDAEDIAHTWFRALRALVAHCGANKRETS
ncbi:non-ribosomal peptide synthetase [Streptomyces aurantiacus]|uniref:Putative Dimodular nonribosomal peptide synthase n=1 Tax=Streptomyces aurantiacus JA 4570 TaxID=1286094 RepID=S4AT10_9ACTN|nr:non-ribosomal peptide synthetase [Streptomyces aurantiacus]EPH44537.1 putative Dimodular nonribosomal peptide synthase [Streptomyces aurantiacus JA 4570]